MPRIFISYRRDDSRTITGRIYDRLVQAFGADSVFKDVQDIHSGQNWKTVLQQEIEQSDIILAVIGATWMTLTDEAGNRRITNDNDYVRLEVAHGLQDNSCTVIPLLVNQATVPERENLPPDLQPLTERQALRVREDPDFHTDMGVLIRDIYRLTGTEPAPSSGTHVSQIPAPPQQTGFQLSGALSGCSFNLAVTLGMFVLVAGIGAALIGDFQLNSGASSTQVVAARVTSEAETQQRTAAALTTPTLRLTATLFVPPPGLQTPAIQLTDSTCSLQPRLKPGAPAMTQRTPDERGLPLHRLADAESRVLAYLPAEIVVTVLEGPVCADGLYWWLVEADSLDEVGWTIEGFSGSYYLAPMD